MKRRLDMVDMVWLTGCNTSVRMTTEADWSRLLDSIESRRSKFEDLLLRATEIVEKFFLHSTSTPVVDFGAFPMQLPMRQSSVSDF
jgi:hypothetical protein